MSQSLPPIPAPAVTPPIPILPANEELAAEITAALLANKLVAPEDDARAKTLLTAGTVKTGEWRTLLEKPLFSATAAAVATAVTTSTDTSDATPHNPA